MPTVVPPTSSSTCGAAIARASSTSTATSASQKRTRHRPNRCVKASQVNRDVVVEGSTDEIRTGIPRVRNQRWKRYPAAERLPCLQVLWYRQGGGRPCSSTSIPQCRNTEGYRPGNSGWSTLASAIPPRWEAGGGRHLALAGDDPRCAYQPLARCWCGALARHGGSTSVGCAWCAHAHTAPPSCR